MTVEDGLVLRDFMCGVVLLQLYVAYENNPTVWVIFVALMISTIQTTRGTFFSECPGMLSVEVFI